MTIGVSSKQLSNDGSRRGLNPNSLKNLRPGNPPRDKLVNAGYSVTSEVKDILRAKERRHRIAETMVAESEAGNVPMIRELLDRTEGKVPGDSPPPVNVNVQFVIGRGYRDTPLIESSNGNSD